MKKSVALFLSLMVAASASALAGTYKIGATLSATGGASFLGDPEQKTLELLADQINKSGGINGNKLELIVFDDEANPAKARTNMERLIRKDRVSVVIGSSTSGASIALTKLASRYKTPLVSMAASHKIVFDSETNQVEQWVFKTAQTDTLVVENLFTHMKANGINKVAVLSATDGFGQSGREQVLALAKRFGIDIVADEKHGKKDSDLNTQLLNIKKSNAQALIHFSIGSPAIISVRAWKGLDMNNVLFFHNHGFGSPKNLEILGDAAEGIYFPLGNVNIPDLIDPSSPQYAPIKKYHKDYVARYNEPVSTFGGHAWDAMMMVVEAMKHVGDNKGKIRDYLENNIRGFVGMHGIFNMSKIDHNGLDKSSLTLLKVHSGKMTLVK